MPYGLSCMHANNSHMPNSSLESFIPRIALFLTLIYVKDGSGNDLGTVASAPMVKPGTAQYGVANGFDPMQTLIPVFGTRTVRQTNPVPGAYTATRTYLQC